MTIYELHYRFKLLVDKIAGESTAEFTSKEVDTFLNIAAEDFIKNTFSTKLEVTQRQSDELYSIITVENIQGVKIGSNNTNFKLPVDYWFDVYDDITIKNRDCSVTSKAFVKNIRHNELQTLFDDPFNKPDKDNVYRLIQSTGNNTNILIYHSTTTDPINLELHYIKKIAKIEKDVSYTTNNWKFLEYWLPEPSHMSIVEMAVQRASGTIQHPAFQTNQVFLQDN